MTLNKSPSELVEECFQKLDKFDKEIERHTHTNCTITFGNGRKALGKYDILILQKSKVRR